VTREAPTAHAAVGATEAWSGLKAAYDALSRALENLDDGALLRPTLCSGWVVGDLVFHHMLDAQRALIAFATPSDEPPDVDFVSYWRPWSAADESAVAHARFVRIAASAYSSPASLVAHRRETADAALRAASAAREGGRVATQGHTLTVPDFMATLAVEATVHHLDLVAFLDDAPGPEPTGLALVRRTLDGLAGGRVDVGWDDVTYALKGTGRSPLSPHESKQLGAVANAFPLFS
jgi:uncharacterized protein (TIGR03083 family)